MLLLLVSNQVGSGSNTALIGASTQTKAHIIGTLQIDGIDNVSASIANAMVSANTGSLIITASLSGSTQNVIEFEKGDGTTFNINIDTGSIFDDTGSFATTASNNFQATQTIDNGGLTINTLTDARIILDKGTSAHDSEIVFRNNSTEDWSIGTGQIGGDNNFVLRSQGSANYFIFRNTGDLEVRRSASAEFITASRFDGDGSLLTNITASYIEWDNVDSKPDGILSSSAQVTAHGFISESFNTDGTGIVSSSTQTVSLLTGQDITLGAVTATSFNSAIVSSSILFTSGSNIFGDEATDIHEFTGSVQVLGGITGSLLGTASTASHALITNTASHADFAEDAAFSSTASYVTTAQTASYVTTSQTASYITSSNIVGFIQASAIDYVDIIDVPDDIISSSAQITAHGFVSESFTTAGTDIVSGSVQIASEISGAFNASSASFATSTSQSNARLNVFDGLGLVSGSSTLAQLNALSASGDIHFSGNIFGDGSRLTGITSSLIQNGLLFGDGLQGGTYNGDLDITGSLDTSSVHFISGSEAAIVGIPDLALTGSLQGTADTASYVSVNNIDGDIVEGIASSGNNNITIGGTSANPSISVNLSGVSSGNFIHSAAGTLTGSNLVQLLSDAESPFLPNALAGDIGITSNLRVEGDSTLNGNADVDGTLQVTGTGNFTIVSNGTVNLGSGALSSAGTVTFSGLSAASGETEYLAINDAGLLSSVDLNATFATDTEINSATQSLSQSLAATIEDVIDGTITVENSTTASYVQAGNIVGSIAANSVDWSDVENVVDGLVSSSAQTVANLPTGTVSSSAQITAHGFISESFSTDGTGTVSGSAQIVSLLDGQDVTLGDVSATSINTSIVSSSITFTSGSNIFGDEASDVHEFTGSVEVLGSISVASLTGSLQGTATLAIDATNADTASYVLLAKSASYVSAANIDGDITADSIAYTNITGIPANLVSSSAQITAHGFISESFSTGGTGIVSGSIQIASDISGAFTEASGALAIMANETSSSLGLLSSSYEVSSASFSTRIQSQESFSASLDSTFATDTEINAATQSLSQSIATDLTTAISNVSGAFTSTSASFASTIDGLTSDYTELTNIPNGILSSSAQVTAHGFISESFSTDGTGIISSSVQINHDATTNFVAGEHFLQSAITTVGTVTTGNINAILPDGILSGSDQTITNLLNQDVNFGTGDITASAFSGDGSGLSNIDVAQVQTVTANFSGVTSQTFTHNFDTENVVISVYNNSTPPQQVLPQTVELTDSNSITVTFPSAQSGHVVIAKGGHIVSGSSILDTTNTNIISSSAQITAHGFISESFSTDGTGIVSQSAQVVSLLNGQDVTLGDVSATSINTSIVSSSITFTSGSNIFGDEASDVHEFTGSIQVLGGITGSILGTATTASYINSSNIDGDITATSASYVTAATVTNVTTHRETVSGATSYAVNHNLNERYPIVQCWNTSNNQMEIPQSITSNTVNRVTVDFGLPFTGRIVVKL